MSKASELIEHILYSMTDRTKAKGPGQVVLGLSEEKRNVLKELTSEELQNIRPDSIWGIRNQ